MQIDPEGRERRALDTLVAFEGAAVLEIGSGDGRLARVWTDRAVLCVGVDLDRPSDDGALHLGTRATATQLPFRKHAFDIAVLGWSL